MERPGLDIGGEARRYRGRGDWKEAMAANPSRMEIAVAVALQAKGVRFRTQVPMSVTSADIEVERGGKPLFVFLDGPVHEGREDRDEEVRRLLAKRGCDILELRYSSYSRRARDRLVGKILEETR